MPVENKTPNRLYPVPYNDNQLDFDVARLIAALTAIDLDVANLFAALLTKSNTDHGHVIADITGLAAALTAKQDTDKRGIANGYAALGADGKVPADQLPAAIFGAMSYQGTWNANTNSPTIPAAAAANKGHYYKVAVAGTTTVGGVNDWQIGDWVVSNGASWDKIDNTDQVMSVAGLQGAITAAALAAALSAERFTNLKFSGTLNGGPLGGFRNKIINGDGRVNQRTYTTVADDVYWCDRHYVLTQTAAILPTILSNVANGLPSMMRLKQNQAAAQRMGNAQIIEGIESRALRGKQVTLGGWLRCSVSQPIRYAILEWTGAEDAVTSDVVNNWTNATFTAGQFFLGANLTVAAVGTVTPNASALTKWSQVANISGACNNLIVFLWTEGAAAQDTVLDMTWGLVEGDATSEDNPFSPRHSGQELALCQRYGAPAIGTGRVTSATAGTLLLTFPTPLRTSSPSLSVVNGVGAIREMGVGSRDLTSVTFVSGSNSAAYASFISSGMTAGNGIALDPMLPRVFADMEL